MHTETKITILKNRKVRKILYQNERWFSVVDICGVLTEGPDVEACWKELKQKLLDEGCAVAEIIRRLELKVGVGKKHFIDCVNMEGMLRVIQSIQSPKAELLKSWLAQGGNESIQEFEDLNLSPKGSGCSTNFKVTVMNGLAYG